MFPECSGCTWDNDPMCNAPGMPVCSEGSLRKSRHKGQDAPREEGNMPLTRDTNEVYCKSCRYGPTLAYCDCPCGCSMGDKFQSKGGQKPQREEPVMDSLTTYAYEVLVREKWDENGVQVRAVDLVARSKYELEEPTRESLLVKYAEELAGRGIESFEREVVVNIRPFCG